MVEFLICASFVLIPLFLGISLLAKYIDMKQAAIQAARYEAWEYTTWYANSNEPMTGFSAAKQPIKSLTRVKKETRRRFFTNIGDEEEALNRPIEDNDGNTGWLLADRNRLWTDHEGRPLYSGTDGAGAALKSSESTPTLPIVGKVMNILFDIVDFAFSAIASLMNLLGSSVGFTAINTDGYAKATVSMAVRSTPNFIDVGTMKGNSKVNISNLNPGNLAFSARAGVVTDGWNAGGVEQTYNQAGGTVPTVLLKELLTLPGLAQIWDVIAILAPELRRCHPSIPALPPFGNPDFPKDKGSLWLGHIDIDAVHPDRLENGGSHSCDDAGRCNFEPVTPRDPALWDCIP